MTQNIPLSEQMRPKTFHDILGQISIQRNPRLSGAKPTSMILWGPSGCGKTTLAKVIGERPDYNFVEIASTSSGVPQLRKIIETAESSEKPTILFVDEIHRWGRVQQDALLKSVEKGTITLIGATTENPSFTIAPALRSRAPVVILDPLDHDALSKIFDKSCEKIPGLTFEDDAKNWIIKWCNGDARALINIIEQISGNGTQDPISVKTLEEQIHSFQKSSNNDDHYEYLSAIHKSCRASDVDAALYWVGRALSAGTNPNTPPDSGLMQEIFRRLTCVASEDIGMADPQALVQVQTARQAYEFIGWPEGRIVLGQAICYVATAPKSNASYMSINRALSAARNTQNLKVPNHATNAPTKMMRDMGKHEGYIYDHDTPRAFSGLDYLPPELIGTKFYEPVPRGYEDIIIKRLESWNARRIAKRNS